MRETTLFAMAAEQEYGPALKARIKPVMIGVGPVEAAVNLTAELSARAHRGELPKLVVSLGSAGSRRLRHAEVYQATSIAYRDIDASPLGFPKGTTPLLDLPAVIPLPLRVPGVPEASLSTGGNVVSGAAYDLVDADMVDMETFALWRASQKFAVPLLGLRGISDGKAELTKFSDWTEYLHIIDEKLATIVDRILAGEVVAAE
ncbi:5'-methylthioadenosine/S-adenosylhomocysteine nucleosidase [Pleomorphomonas diazotrophica]|uniref:5'-methylthioadenosine/S-adenosylhomocysteine nucleosidase n=1 Tax=Pleomorphomonas diazotrophica TaxID=1166257 RepID=A0A1I4W611_9HYPH|nr:5'-methylthioadenosine/S-adenosylhomocysteine nucleosidase [Pleomorphomonas diazotrophica]PKR87892.1 5'-methylthioadenosine/S-adenosylhomocysteine nucleosidase [Pleomorphomonas diazotrophica]SFN08817.1 adenosylhomocysteine nucleosidase [Pleomorphomonas diazotrophica]